MAAKKPAAAKAAKPRAAAPRAEAQRETEKKEQSARSLGKPWIDRRTGQCDPVIEQAAEKMREAGDEGTDAERQAKVYELVQHGHPIPA